MSAAGRAFRNCLRLEVAPRRAFPRALAQGPHGGVPAAVAPVDDALGGGLPAGRLTELVSAVPSSGGQTVLASLIAATQAARQRIALVDGSDAFAPGAVPGDMLRHLVWVRCSAPHRGLRRGGRHPRARRKLRRGRASTCAGARSARCAGRLPPSGTACSAPPRAALSRCWSRRSFPWCPRSPRGLSWAAPCR